MKAGFNSETGNPRILDDDGNVLARGLYSSLATLPLEVDLDGNPTRLLAVASDYWLGALPVNQLLEVKLAFQTQQEELELSAHTETFFKKLKRSECECGRPLRGDPECECM